MKKLLTLLLTAILSTACVNGANPQVSTPTRAAVQQPSPLATNTAAITSTASITQAPSATPTVVDSAAFFRDAEAALKNYQPTESDPTPLRDALAQGVIQFLQANASPEVALDSQSAFQELVSTLAKLQNLPENVKPGVAAIHLKDSEGGSEDLVLISLQRMPGLPVIGIHRLGQSYERATLHSRVFQDGAETGDRNFYVGSVSGQDLTGDGVAEVVYTYVVQGASAVTTELNVERWLADEKELKTIFRSTLVNWAGESRYEFVAAGKQQNIQLTYPWFGIFDHKLTEHPTATQIWSYDPAQDKFVMQSETIEPPRTIRQQVNAAEESLRRGELDKALSEYERAWSDQSLTKEDFGTSQADFRSFARFRQGEVLSLLGRADEAKKALGDAQKSGGDLGKLVAAFLKNYTGKDAALRAWAGLESSIDLYNIVYHDDIPSNLGFPFDAPAIYYKGEVVAAYLDAHPEAVANPNQAFKEVGSLGLKLLNPLAVDLDGDGVNEFVFVTQEGGASPNQGQTLWMVYRSSNGQNWIARDLLRSDSLALQGNTMQLPRGKGSAIKLSVPQQEPPELVLTWNRTRVIYLDPASLEPRARQDEWPVLGEGRVESGF